MKTKFIPTAFSFALICILTTAGNASAQSPAPSPGKKPNILVIMGDDIGWYNPSIYNRGDMGYATKWLHAKQGISGIFRHELSESRAAAVCRNVV